MPLAVIPFFELPSLRLGDFATIQSFGVLSAIGILVAVQVAANTAKSLGRDPQVILDFAVAGVLTGILVGHLVHLFFYHPEELQKPGGGFDVARLFKLWEGLSSMGGLLGGVLAAAAFFRVRRIRFHDYADAFGVGVPTGWAIARVGCFTVHDHIGRLTDFPLAVPFPGGSHWPSGTRHDLGLYEAFLLFAIAGVVYAMHRRDVLRGRLLAVTAVLYAIGRFLLDFLRATDIGYADRRYAGLTPAQWLVLAVLAYGVWGLTRRLAPEQRAAAPVPAKAASGTRKRR